MNTLRELKTDLTDRIVELPGLKAELAATENQEAKNALRIQIGGVEQVIASLNNRIASLEQQGIIYIFT